MKIFKHVKSLTLAALALALVCVAFASTTKASAAVTIATGVTAAYNPETDQIDITAPDKTNVKIYVLKNADAEIGEKDKPAATMTVSGTSISVVLNDKKKGLKAAENKDLYLYISAVSGEAVSAKKANFKLAGTNVKKIDSVTFDYAKAYEGSELAVVTVKATGTASGATSAVVDAAKVAIADLKGSKKEFVANYTGATLKGAQLFTIFSEEELVKGKLKAVKHTLSVKIKGSAENVTVDGKTYNGMRNSKAKAVSPKAPAKAPKVKVDFLKGTIALKPGFDFVVRTAEATTASAIEAEEWKTILPIDENGTGTQFVGSTSYTYVKKLTDESTAADKASFYNGDKKLKTLDLSTLCREKWEDDHAVSGTAIIYVRKTATDKAPASKVSEAIKVTKPAAAIEITVSGSAITATYDSKKKAFTLGTDKISGANANGGYEYLVVTKAQYDAGNIDFNSSKWGKFDPSKPLKTALKSNNVYKNKVNESLKESVSTVDADKEIVANIYVLIRGAGVKENAKKNIVGALPTGHTVTQFVTVGSGDNATVEWRPVVTTP